MTAPCPAPANFWDCQTVEDCARWAMADATRRADEIKRKLRYRQIEPHKREAARLNMEWYRAVAAEELKTLKAMGAVA